MPIDRPTIEGLRGVVINRFSTTCARPAPSASPTPSGGRVEKVSWVINRDASAKAKTATQGQRHRHQLSPIHLTEYCALLPHSPPSSINPPQVGVYQTVGRRSISPLLPARARAHARFRSQNRNGEDGKGSGVCCRRSHSPETDDPKGALTIKRKQKSRKKKSAPTLSLFFRTQDLHYSFEVPRCITMPVDLSAPLRKSDALSTTPSPVARPTAFDFAGLESLHWRISLRRRVGGRGTRYAYSCVRCVEGKANAMV